MNGHGIDHKNTVVQSIVVKWFELVKKGNRQSYEVAKYLYEVWDKVAQKDDMRFRIFASQTLLETREQVTVDLRMVKAFEAVPGKTIWEKLGAKGVEALVHLVPEENRAAFGKEAGRRAVRHGVLGGTQIENLCEKFSKKQVRTPIERDISRVHPATQLTILRAEFKKLFKKHPKLMTELSPEAREVLKDILEPKAELVSSAR